MNPWDVFFYYGDDPKETTKQDIYVGVLQPRNAMFFNRSYGADVSNFENRSGLAKIIEMRYNIADFIARRNLDVPDKIKAYASQNEILVENVGRGQIDVIVNYYDNRFNKQEELRV